MRSKRISQAASVTIASLALACGAGDAATGATAAEPATVDPVSWP
jgi:hypothetical protein